MFVIFRFVSQSEVEICGKSEVEESDAGGSDEIKDSTETGDELPNEEKDRHHRGPVNHSLPVEI